MFASSYLSKYTLYMVMRCKGENVMYGSLGLLPTSFISLFCFQLENGRYVVSLILYNLYAICVFLWMCKIWLLRASCGAWMQGDRSGETDVRFTNSNDLMFILIRPMFFDIAMMNMYTCIKVKALFTYYANLSYLWC